MHLIIIFLLSQLVEVNSYCGQMLSIENENVVDVTSDVTDITLENGKRLRIGFYSLTFPNKSADIQMIQKELAMRQQFGWVYSYIVIDVCGREDILIQSLIDIFFRTLHHQKQYQYSCFLKIHFGLKALLQYYLDLLI